MPGENWKTFPVFCRSGLMLNLDALEQATKYPGSAISLVNYESSLEGGYSSIKGFIKYDSTVIPGTGVVKGCFITRDNKVIGQRGTEVYKSTGAGWTQINGVDTRTDSVKCRAAKFTWDKQYIVVVDGGPLLKPYMYDSGGTYTSLASAPAGQTNVIEFKRYLWFCNGGELVTSSQPGDPTAYSTGSGAAQINTGMGVTGMAVWRDELYLFSNSQIKKITGTSNINWAVVPVAENIGCINPDTIQELGGDIVYLADDGIRTVAGTAQINDRNLNNLSQNINVVVSALGHDDLCSMVVRDKNQYRVFRANEALNAASCLGIIGVTKEPGNWEWSTTSGIKAFCADSAIYNGEHTVIFANWDGYVYQGENGEDFDGVKISTIYQTPHLIFSDTDLRKVLYRLCAYFKTEGIMELTLGTLIDYGVLDVVQPSNKTFDLEGGAYYFDDPSTIILFDGSPVFFDVLSVQKPCVNLNGSGKNASFIFSNNITSNNATHTIQSISIQFNEAAKR